MYVNDATGQDTNTCGSNETPCKTLKHGIHRTEINGTLYIIGVQKISETITLNRDIHIRGIEATITHNKCQHSCPQVIFLLTHNIKRVFQGVGELIHEKRLH